MHSMETKRQTESVLAKLMGIDEPVPNKQGYRGCQRVLSESYLQDIALICQRQKWSFDRYSMDTDEMVEREDSSEEMGSSSSSEEFLERHGREAGKGFWLLNSVQKADRDYYALFGANYSPTLLNSPKEMESFSHVPPKSFVWNENEGMSNTSSALRKKGLYSGRKEKDCLRYRREALGHGSTVSNSVAKQVANQLEKSVWHDSLNAFGCGNTMDRGFGVRYRSPENMNTGKSNVGHTQTQSTSNSTSVPSTGNPKSRSRTFSVHPDWCLDLVNGGRSYCNGLQELKCQSEDLRRRNSMSIDSVCEEDNASHEETPLISCDLNEFGKNDLVEKVSKCSDVESVANQAGERVLDKLFDMLQEIGSCGNEDCKKFDASAEQVVDNTLKPLHESDNDSPLCPSPTEAYKVNPESFSKSKDTSYKVISGSEVELEQPVTKFFEPEAERNMRSKKMRFDNKDITLGTDKSKEIHILPYLVDVLNELCIHSGEKKLSLGHGQPLESFIDPSVFENLEKKFSEQPCLPKSERKLLFDRIKGGLSDILSPYVDLSAWRQCSMKRRIIEYNEDDMIKEDLLAALACQEKEVRKESSKKMDGIEMDWLELEEDEQTIAMEMEAILIDELVEEIISTELI